MNIESEKKLLSDIGKDPAKFGIVFDLYYGSIFGYVFRRIADYDLACDITSETFLKGFLNIGNFRWKGIPVCHWLYRIANNEVQQYFRRKKYRPASMNLLIERSGWDAIDPRTTNEERLQLEKEIEKHQDFIFIQERIRQLPVIYQEALSLRYFEQKSIKEVSAILAKREGTVKSLLSRGIEKLKKML